MILDRKTGAVYGGFSQTEREMVAVHRAVFIHCTDGLNELILNNGKQVRLEPNIAGCLLTQWATTAYKTFY